MGEEEARGLASPTAADMFPELDRLELEVAGSKITFESGRVGRQANGAVLVQQGDTVLYTTACAAAEDSAGSSDDFMPLTVHYQERYSAAGRTSGGFLKRESRPRDQEVLVARLIDRPLRPLFPKGYAREVQMLTWVLSYDGVNSTEPLAICANSAALVLSDIPLTKPIAGVRVGLLPEIGFVVNPTVEQIGDSQLDLVMAGTKDAVMMVEGYCNFLTEEQMLEAVELGHKAIVHICSELEAWGLRRGKPKAACEPRQTNVELMELLRKHIGADMDAAVRVRSKQERQVAMQAVRDKALALLSEEAKAVEVDSDATNDDIPVYPEMEVKQTFKRLQSDIMRTIIIKEGLRSDGRGVTDIRPIATDVGLLPRVHGSALFTRGETQALAVVTLGSDSMGQRTDNLDGQDVSRFYLQYFFPHSSVGEVGRVGAPGRREIGHGMLAERALAPALPDRSAFPYTMRVESTITESNGSSSMASVCGGCIALLHAGVPLTTPVAGVAMGLVLDERAPGGAVVLTDILGSEDALGDMDFKVAGAEHGITAFQMDIKVEGITIPVMAQALRQALDGRRHILGAMARCYPSISGELSAYAPRIITMQIDPSKVATLIGTGGKQIRSIIEQCGVETIDVDQTGFLRICAAASATGAADKAALFITGLVSEPVVGTTYEECKVTGVVAFGVFVEILPGREGLVHVSELDVKRTADPAELFKEGDIMDACKLLEVIFFSLHLQADCPIAIQFEAPS
eukprot:jgi/Chlat1/1813/Chrsp135S08688